MIDPKEETKPIRVDTEEEEDELYYELLNEIELERIANID